MQKNEYGEIPYKNCLKCKDFAYDTTEICKCGSKEFIYREMTCLGCGAQAKRYQHSCRVCQGKEFTTCSDKEVIYNFNEDCKCKKCNSKMLFKYVDNLCFQGSIYVYMCEKEECGFHASLIKYCQ